MTLANTLIPPRCFDASLVALVSRASEGSTTACDHDQGCARCALPLEGVYSFSYFSRLLLSDTSALPARPPRSTAPLGATAPQGRDGVLNTYVRMVPSVIRPPSRIGRNVRFARRVSPSVNLFSADPISLSSKTPWAISAQDSLRCA